MLNRSETKLDRAGVAGSAQVLRGGGVFGAVAFSEKAVIQAERLQLEMGYADCLPLYRGGYWRDPVSPGQVETIK